MEDELLLGGTLLDMWCVLSQNIMHEITLLITTACRLRVRPCYPQRERSSDWSANVTDEFTSIRVNIAWSRMLALAIL